MAIPLEDTFTDVIGKAQRGLGISDSQLADEAGIGADQIRKLRTGSPDEEILGRIAPVLKLNADALVDLASGTWKPADVKPIDGLAAFNTPFDDMTVNSYLLWDPTDHRAIAFDTGTDCSEMLAAVEQHKLTVDLILLTHSHSDHIAALDHLKQQTGAPIFVSGRERVTGAEPIEEGRTFQTGKLHIGTRLTWGHSRGGLTYFVTGLARPVAVVGDSLFAASMGGGSVSYEAALQNNRDKILTLPDETIVCPGHGPLTTVGHEKKYNVFFADSR